MISLLPFLENLSVYHLIYIAICLFIFLSWVFYELCRLVGTAQSGDIDWGKYEPGMSREEEALADQLNKQYNAKE